MRGEDGFQDPYGIPCGWSTYRVAFRWGFQVASVACGLHERSSQEVKVEQGGGAE